MLTCSLSLTACGNSANNNQQTGDAVTEDFSDVETEYYLENGYYTVGVDIPAGVCSIYATAGTGNILYSADGTIDTYSDFDDDLNQLLSNEAGEMEEIVDYTLKEGYTIRISGAVRAKMTFSQVTSRCAGREYDEENKIALEPGTYTAGTDFEAGVYTITATDGDGTLYSSNAFALGVDEMFGVFDGTETYVPKTVNVTLNEGDTLEATDVSIEMIKVKQFIKKQQPEPFASCLIESKDCSTHKKRVLQSF